MLQIKTTAMREESGREMSNKPNPTSNKFGRNQTRLDRIYLETDFKYHDIRERTHGRVKKRRCIKYIYDIGDKRYIFYFNPDHDEYVERLIIESPEGREILCDKRRAFVDNKTVRTKYDKKFEQADIYAERDI